MLSPNKKFRILRRLLLGIAGSMIVGGSVSAADRVVRVQISDASTGTGKVANVEPTPAVRATKDEASNSAATEPTPAQPLPVPEPTQRADAPTPAKRSFRVEAAAPSKEPVVESGNGGESPSETPLEANSPIEVVQQRYPSGALMLEREVTQDAEGNYINHGAWRMWDQEGNLVVDGNCRDNQLHGLWKRIYQGKESKLFSEAPYHEFEKPFLSVATFEDGMLHGRWTIRDAQDRKISEIEFADGDRHGSASWWYANGKTMQTIPFRNGFVDGVLRHWSPEGNLLNEESYISGRKQETEVATYSNGKTKSEIGYLLPQLVTQSADDWWNAKLAVFGVQGEREKHGVAVVFHSNGQKQSEITFEHGQMSGTCRWWYPNGQLATEGEYQKGQLHSHWNWWHSNGQKAAVGEYLAGLPTGNWQWWQEDGRLKSKLAPGQKMLPPQPDADEQETPRTVRTPGDLRYR